MNALRVIEDGIFIVLRFEFFIAPEKTKKGKRKKRKMSENSFEIGLEAL
jgi:hypothetical protein